MKEELRNDVQDKDIRKVPKRGNKSRKQFKGQRDKRSDFNLSGDKIYRRGPNDIAWRTQDELLAKLSANLPFGVAAGLPMEMYQSPISYTTTQKFRQPGVIVVNPYITVGNATGYNSPINLASRKIYSFIRHANSGSKNYEAVDLTLYFGALGQVLCLLSWLQRLYTVTTYFKTTNRYTPRTLVRSMCADYDDIIANQAQLKYLIAWMGRAVGSLAFPDLPYFKACYESMKYIYVDSKSPKEQFYLLHPAGLMKYDPTFNSNGGGLTTTLTNAWQSDPNTATPMTFATLHAIVHELVDVLLSDEDCGIMSGDILKAYSDGQLWKPEAMIEGYEVCVDSDEVKQQFHNVSTVPITLGGYGQNLGGTAQAPYLEQVVSATGSAYSNTTYAIDGEIIDAFSTDPDFKEVINCTVLLPAAKVKSAGAGTNQIAVDAGSACFDLFLPVNAYVILESDLASRGFVSFSLKNHLNRRRWVSTLDTFPVSLASNFDWHPIMHVVGTTTIGGTSYEIPLLVGDIQNMRVFDHSVLERIHENNTLSLFGYVSGNFAGTK